ncbi:MAG: S8 family peptidase [Elusimicrobia bacterium]|nr:S8 family peptidase [Elusimicrobiota bacterium]
MTRSRKPLGLLAVIILTAIPASAQVCPLSDEDSVQRIVSCKPGVALADCRTLAQSAGCAVVRELESINAIVIIVPKSRAGLQEGRLKSLKEVDRVDPDERINWLKAVEPALNDFRLPAPAAIVRFQKAAAPEPAADDPEQPWGIKRVKAAAAWSRTQGQGIKVAIIDTGVDATHPDLSAAVAGGFNAVDPANPGDFADDQGHGTHVAGTIAAARDGQGVVGVAPKTRLYAVKVLDRFGNGSFSEIIAGIEWAVKNKMQIANMSLGADEGSEPLLRAVKAAYGAGLVIVAAAGNASGGPVSFPGAYPETIAVSASDKADALAPYSSVGDAVGFIAPGSSVLSCAPGGKFVEHSGTSMAAPHVSGLAALAISLGARGPEGVRAALARAASPLPGLSPPQQGAGMIDAGRLNR